MIVVVRNSLEIDCCLQVTPFETEMIKHAKSVEFTFRYTSMSMPRTTDDIVSL